MTVHNGQAHYTVCIQCACPVCIVQCAFSVSSVHSVYLSSVHCTVCIQCSCPVCIVDMSSVHSVFLSSVHCTVCIQCSCPVCIVHGQCAWTGTPNECRMQAGKFMLTGSMWTCSEQVTPRTLKISLNHISVFFQRRHCIIKDLNGCLFGLFPLTAIQ